MSSNRLLQPEPQVMMCTNQNPVPCRTKVRLILNLEGDTPSYQGICHDCHSNYHFSAVGDKEVGYRLGQMLSFEHKGEPADPILLQRRDEMNLDFQSAPGYQQPPRGNINQQSFRPTGQGNRPQQGIQNQPRPFQQQGNRPQQQGNRPQQQGNRPQQQENRPMQQGNRPQQQGNRPMQQGNRPQQQDNRPMQNRPQHRHPERPARLPETAIEAPIQAKPVIPSVPVEPVLFSRTPAVTPPVAPPEPKIEKVAIETKKPEPVQQPAPVIEAKEEPKKPVRKPRAKAAAKPEVLEPKVVAPAPVAEAKPSAVKIEKTETIEAAPAKRRGRPPKRLAEETKE